MTPQFGASLTDNAGVGIYNRNMFIIQATGDDSIKLFMALSGQHKTKSLIYYQIIHKVENVWQSLRPFFIFHPSLILVELRKTSARVLYYKHIPIVNDNSSVVSK